MAKASLGKQHRARKASRVSLEVRCYDQSYSFTSRCQHIGLRSALHSQSHKLIQQPHSWKLCVGEDCSKNFLVVSFPPTDNVRSCSGQGLWKRKKINPHPGEASQGLLLGRRRGRGGEGAQKAPSTALGSVPLPPGLISGTGSWLPAWRGCCRLARCAWQHGRDVRKAQQLIRVASRALPGLHFYPGARIPTLPHPASALFCMQSVSCKATVHAAAIGFLQAASTRQRLPMLIVV